MKISTSYYHQSSQPIRFAHAGSLFSINTMCNYDDYEMEMLVAGLVGVRLDGKCSECSSFLKEGEQQVCDPCKDEFNKLYEALWSNDPEEPELRVWCTICDEHFFRDEVTEVGDRAFLCKDCEETCGKCNRCETMVAEFFYCNSCMENICSVCDNSSWLGSRSSAILGIDEVDRCCSCERAAARRPKRQLAPRAIEFSDPVDDLIRNMKRVRV